MSLKLLRVLVCFFSVVSYAQPKKENTPLSYIAYKTNEEIVIDGKADELVWEKADWSANFIDIEGDKSPKYQTNIKMLWDENYFYIFAKMQEPHVWGNLKKRDTVIFYNNDFEIFIDPDGDTHNYYELEINALNTVWDLFLTKPYRELNSTVLNDWNATGLKSAISINGTLNNHNDKDKGWTLEIAIPFEQFKIYHGQNIVPKDNFWRVNFSRVNWDFQIDNGAYGRKKNKSGKFLPEYNWVWSPMGVINMHEPEKWGYVYFSSKKVGSNVTFNISKDEEIKWKLYELYRAQKKYYSVNKRWLTSMADIVIDNKALQPVIENHSQGFNIIIKSPFSGKELVINGDGRFMLK